MDNRLEPKERLLGIDGLRGLAVLWVLLEHAGRSWGLVPGTYAYEWVNRGGLGVTVFFGISGFVITRLLVRHHLEAGVNGLAAFWRARAVRLMPAFLVYLAGLWIMGWLGGPQVAPTDMAWSGCGAWNYRGLFRAAENGASTWFLGHTWSLSLEQQFYLGWPLVLLALGSGQRLRVVMVALILLSPAIRVASYFFQPETRGMIGMMIHTRLDAMLSGCLLALCESTWRSHPVAVRYAGLWVALAALFCVFLAPAFGQHYRGGYWLTIGFMLDSLLAILLVVWATIWSPNWLASGVLLWVGRISYSLYLWQQFFLGDTLITRALSWPMALAVAVGVGAASYYCVELPAQRWHAAHWGGSRLKPS
ncbi:MAG: acyltransferase [Acidobacteria bacterium]|nr:acyltransferase [Acidobacteriota bacterium]